MSDSDNQRECDGSCGKSYPTNEMNTVPTSGPQARYVCDECAEKHFGVDTGSDQ